MKPITDALIDQMEEEKAFAVGVMRGTWAGLGITITLLILGALIPVVWRWGFAGTTPSVEVNRIYATKVEPFRAATIYKNVPFIRLTDEAIRYGLNNPSARRVIEREMLSRAYFEADLLKGRTQYIPKLRDPNNFHSAITLVNRQMRMVVVQLVNDDGSLGAWGLIDLAEYEDDIRSLGR